MYVSWEGGAGGVHMGLRPISLEHWLRPRAYSHPSLLDTAAKQRLLRSLGAGLVVSNGDSDAAEELFDLAAEHRPDLERHNERNALLDATLQLHEDICLLQRDRQGDYRLTDAVVFAQAHWRLSEKTGQTLSAIHSPVAGMQKIEDPMRQMFDRLPARRPFERGNWHFDTDPTLYQPQPRGSLPAPLDEDQLPRTLWLRTERQTLLRLPRSGAIVFTIGTEVTSLEQLSRNGRALAGLSAAVAALNQEDYAARGGGAILRPFQNWAAQVAK